MYFKILLLFLFIAPLFFIFSCTSVDDGCKNSILIETVFFKSRDERFATERCQIQCDEKGLPFDRVDYKYVADKYINGDNYPHEYKCYGCED